MSSVEKIVEQSLLYDFYGELLTEHQRKVYEAALFEDYSLSEIAEEEGISRQGVHDLIRRCDRQLKQYESKLHLVERFTRVRADVAHINKLIENLQDAEPETVAEIRAITERVMEEL